MEYPIQQYGFENAQVMVMDDIPPYDTQDYDLFNEKDFKKYIEDIERLVRSSREYREEVQYMRKYICNDLFHPSLYVNDNFLYCYMIICVCSIFTVGILIDFMRKFILNYLYSKIEKCFGGKLWNSSLPAGPGL